MTISWRLPRILCLKPRASFCPRVCGRNSLDGNARYPAGISRVGGRGLAGRGEDSDKHTSHRADRSLAWSGRVIVPLIISLVTRIIGRRGILVDVCCARVRGSRGPDGGSGGDARRVAALVTATPRASVSVVPSTVVPTSIVSAVTVVSASVVYSSSVISSTKVSGAVVSVSVGRPSVGVIPPALCGDRLCPGARGD